VTFEPFRKLRPALLCLLFPMVGCTTLQGFLDDAERPHKSAVPDANRELMDPINRTYFELASPEQGVIG
jgi:hypothetical protein